MNLFSWNGITPIAIGGSLQDESILLIKIKFNHKGIPLNRHSALGLKNRPHVIFKNLE